MSTTRLTNHEELLLRQVHPAAQVPDPAHAYVDFEPLSNSQRKAKARLLTQRAIERGCLYTEQE